MLCKSFLDMTPLEQSTFAGMVLHCVENDETFFAEGQRMIKRGEKKGLFIGVKINPTTIAPTIDNELIN